MFQTNRFLEKHMGQAVSITQLAMDLGVSREHLTRALNGHGCGKKLAKAIEDWSDGRINRLQLMYPDEFWDGVPSS